MGIKLDAIEWQGIEWNGVVSNYVMLSCVVLRCIMRCRGCCEDDDLQDLLRSRRTHSNRLV